MPGSHGPSRNHHGILGGTCDAMEKEMAELKRAATAAALFYTI